MNQPAGDPDRDGVIVGFAEGKVDSEHIYRDQASVLVQAGLLDPSLVPARGAEQARTVEGAAIDNALIAGWQLQPADHR